MWKAGTCTHGRGVVQPCQLWHPDQLGHGLGLGSQLQVDSQVGAEVQERGSLGAGTQGLLRPSMPFTRAEGGNGAKATCGMNMAASAT